MPPMKRSSLRCDFDEALFTFTFVRSFVYIYCWFNVLAMISWCRLRILHIWNAYYMSLWSWYSVISIICFRMRVALRPTNLDDVYFNKYHWPFHYRLNVSTKMICGMSLLTTFIENRFNCSHNLYYKTMDKQNFTETPK